MHERAGAPDTMALTLHYTLSTRSPLSDDAVADLAARARTFAAEAEVESVSRPERVGPDTPLAHEWVVVPPVRGGATHINVPPAAGHLFTVTVGQGCEPLLLGLCRYPAVVRHRGRDLPTKVGNGWRLRQSCQTQGAGLWGWDHFFHCHLTAIQILTHWRELGVPIRIRDEGGYWPRHSVLTLRRNLLRLNGIFAAVAGAPAPEPASTSVR